MNTFFSQGDGTCAGYECALCASKNRVLPESCALPLKNTSCTNYSRAKRDSCIFDKFFNEHARRLCAQGTKYECVLWVRVLHIRAPHGVPCRGGLNSQSCACCINLDLCAFDKLSNFNESCKPLATNTRKFCAFNKLSIFNECKPLAKITRKMPTCASMPLRVGLMQFSVLEK